MTVKGLLNLSGSKSLVRLPNGLRAGALDLSNCLALTELPEHLQVRRLILSGCASMWFLPAGLALFDLQMRATPLIAVPDDFRVKFRLDLAGSHKLERLPEGLAVGSLILSDCIALPALPEGLAVSFLDISGCVSLKEWPATASIQLGRLTMRNCPQFTALPDGLTSVAQLDLRGCSGIKELPEKLVITSWIDLADTGISTLPAHLHGVALRWKGVPIDQRIAFRPDTITAAEVLAERNVELRRVLLERLGYDRFLQEAKAQTIDRDTDSGGERRLLKVSLPGDEDLVCIVVVCPSTAKQYILRVPPKTRTCKQAAAWIAGFDNANDYSPLKET